MFQCTYKEGYKDQEGNREKEACRGGCSSQGEEEVEEEHQSREEQ